MIMDEDNKQAEHLKAIRREREKRATEWIDRATSSGLPPNVVLGCFEFVFHYDDGDNLLVDSCIDPSKPRGTTVLSDLE